MKEKSKKPKCKDCKFFEFTICLCSLDKPIWHCRDGFTPSNVNGFTCVDMAERNLRIRHQYYRDNPDELQLSLNF